MDYVQLIAVTPEYTQQEGRLNSVEEMIVRAARVGTQSSTGSLERDLRLLEYLYKNNHIGPFEMITFIFRFEAPWFVYNHFSRYRLAAFTAQSDRFIHGNEMFFVPEPSDWRTQASHSHADNALAYLTPIEGQEFTHKFRDLLSQSYELYRSMLNAKVSRDLARLVLPAFSMYVEFWMRIDLHNLLQFLSLRLTDQVPYEVQWYARQIACMLEPIVPNVMRMFYEKHPDLKPVEVRHEEVPNAQ